MRSGGHGTNRKKGGPSPADVLPPKARPAEAPAGAGGQGEGPCRPPQGSQQSPLLRSGSPGALTTGGATTWTFQMSNVTVNCTTLYTTARAGVFTAS